MLKAALAQESEKILACVHCGLCLPVCPTYKQLGNENDSPRGRIYLMRAVAEGRLTQTPAYNKHIDLCLGCRACETVCPSGVPFGRLLETARAEIVDAQNQQVAPALREKDLFMEFVLTQIFTRPYLLKVVWAFSRLFQRSGLANLLAGLFENMPGMQFPLRLLVQAQSNLAKAKEKLGVKESSPFTTSATTRKVAQFSGCVMEGMFSETNQATSRVLAANGCQVAFPANQQCCGALHAHSGLHETAVKLAKANIDAFGNQHSDEPIIINAAGCGAMLKEYGDLLAGDAQYAERARAFSRRVQDISEFLAKLPVKQGNALPVKVTYDAPCHLYHGQNVRQQPIDLIKSIPGVEFVPLVGSENCCGSAGIYNVTHTEMANKVLADKIENIKKTGAQILVTGNPGCAMHIATGLEEAGIDILILHPAELLDLSYRK